jgi:membrane protein
MENKESKASDSSILGRLWSLVVETQLSFAKYECALRAAGLAYHLLLSLFPLLLFLVYLGGRLLSAEGVLPLLNNALEQVIPAAASSVRIILVQIIRARDTIGILGGVLLAWSASAVFTSLSSALNVIWGATPRPFWRRRLVALVTVLVIGSLFILSVWFGALTRWPWPGLAETVWSWLSRVLDWVITVLLLGLVYRLLPNRAVPWSAAFAGAGLAGFLWQIAKVGFVWFLTSGLTNYGLVYGSLASIVSLLLWTYLSGVILFLGATFGSVLEKQFSSNAE